MCLQTGADGAITERMFTAVNVATTQVRISKIVSGTMGERTRSFGFVALLLDHNGDPVPIPAPSGAQAGYAVNEQGAAEFTLSHEQTVTLEGIGVLPGYRLAIRRRILAITRCAIASMRARHSPSPGGHSRLP